VSVILCFYPRIGKINEKTWHEIETTFCENHHVIAHNHNSSKIEKQHLQTREKWW